MTTQHDELVARLERLANSDAKWELAAIAAAVIRAQAKEIEAALQDISGRSEMLLMMQDKYEAERRAREEAEREIIELKAIRASLAERNSVLFARDMESTQRAEALRLEAELAGMEWCEQLCLLERDKADRKKPDTDGGTMNLDHLMGQGWMANLLGKRIRTEIALRRAK